MRELIKKAEKLARMDREINGSFANAPYSVIGEDGVRLRVKIITSDDKLKFVIVRPEEIVGSFEVEAEEDVISLEDK